MRIDELARYLEVPCKVVSIVRTRKERNLVCKSNPETFVDEGGGGIFAATMPRRKSMDDECSVRLELDKVRLDDVE